VESIHDVNSMVKEFGKYWKIVTSKFRAINFLKYLIFIEKTLNKLYSGSVSKSAISDPPSSINKKVMYCGSIVSRIPPHSIVFVNF